MLEGSTQVKPDEHYPLLMVSGAGDAGAPLPPAAVGSVPWNTTVRPKRPWSARWPEYLSTCWMTFILLGISFLVFYAIGMVVIYRTEAYFIVKCNQTRRASDVFYHELILRSAPFPLDSYADYLANVATLYPYLKFNVYFLVDDSKTSTHNFYDKIYPYGLYDEYNFYHNREVRLFQKKYSNVNITVMVLSKYMAMTPLKYRWRNIPTAYLPFYARVFSVWLHGGVGLDLQSHNQKYLLANSRDADWKARALLKLHNDGISAEKYMHTLNTIKRKEETDFFSSFISDMVQLMFNETYWMLNKTIMSFSQTENSSNNIIEPKAVQPDPSSLVRTHRNKRDVAFAPEIDNDNISVTDDDVTAPPPEVNIDLANFSVVNVTGDLGKDNVYHASPNEQNVTNMPDPMPIINKHRWRFNKTLKEKSNESIDKLPERLDAKSEIGNNKSDLPQIVLFYDFSVITEPKRFLPVGRKNKTGTGTPTFVTLETEGSFVASSAHMHPFLGSLLTDCSPRLHPKLAIQNALLTHCSGPSRYEDYCNGVYVL